MPCYVGGPFFSFFTQPQVNVFNRIKVPKKMYLYTDMGTRPWRGNHDELLRWYDFWLKGMDTGIMDEEPIRYHITGSEKWSSAKEWPLETTQWTDFYLGAWASSRQGRTTSTPTPIPSCRSRYTFPKSGHGFNTLVLRSPRTCR